MKLLVTMAALAAALAAQTQPKTFDTPDAAAKALIAAASTNDTAGLNAIFGPKGASILTSGDAAQDQAEREEFVTIAQRKYQLERDSMNPDRMILSIGDEDWPFPVPIVKANGKWHFDTAMGATMVRARRIGADELDAIEICTGYATAEKEYAEQHAGAGYARRMMSTPGKDDGLYSEAHPRVPTRFAQSVEDGVTNAKPKRYHGYYFKVLTAQGPNAPDGPHNYLVKNVLLGGFALVAWPAEYGVTGIHTFLVNQDGVVYEGRPNRPANPLQAPVAQFNPGPDWKAVD
jgi:hypothetical protein